MLNFRRMQVSRFFSQGKSVPALAGSAPLLALCLLVMLAGCKQEEVVPVDYSAIYFKDVRPIDVRVEENPVSANIPALTKRIDLRYPLMVDDTLDISILEFKGDVYAMDYYTNSGRFQGIIPILRGENIEQSIRSDARIFIFRHDSFRRHERSDLEQYVRSFPGYHGGFPQEFLSLPFEHREAGRTSIQTRNFFGAKSSFPVLVQSYRDANLQWHVARSWEQVEEEPYLDWVKQLKAVHPKGVARDVEVTYFNGGEGVNGMATRLAGGRVVVVWGYLDWFDLERKFFAASDRVFEARY